MDEWILCDRENKETVISKSPFRAGRSSNLEIECRSAKVSRNHAHFIIKSNGTLHVQDNESCNGTYINFERIESHTLRQLHVDDEVGLGLHSRLQFEVPEIDLKYIFIVKKRLHANQVIVLDDTDNGDGTVYVPVHGVAESPLTRETLLDILDSDQEVNINQRCVLPSNSLPEESSCDEGGASTSTSSVHRSVITAYEPQRRERTETSTSALNYLEATKSKLKKKVKAEIERNEKDIPSNSTNSINHLTERRASKSENAGPSNSAESVNQLKSKSTHELQRNDRVETTTSSSSINHLTERRASKPEDTGPSNSAESVNQLKSKSTHELQRKDSVETSTSSRSINHLTERRASKTEKAVPSNTAKSVNQLKSKSIHELQKKDRAETSTSLSSINHVTERHASKSNRKSAYELQRKDRDEMSTSASSINHARERLASKPEIKEEGGTSNSTMLVNKLKNNSTHELQRIDKKNLSTSTTSVNHLTKRRTSKLEIKDGTEPSTSATSVNHLKSNSTYESQRQEEGETLTSGSSVNHLKTTACRIEERTERSTSASSVDRLKSTTRKQKRKNQMNLVPSATSVHHLTNKCMSKLQKIEKTEPSNSTTLIKHLKINSTNEPQRTERDELLTSTVNHKRNSICQPQPKEDLFIKEETEQEAEDIIKQEFTDISNCNGNDYTTEDGCIIIDDDDEFPCSQLLNDKPIANNFDQDCLSESIFCAIKKELEELDQPEDGRVYACVDLIDSDGEGGRDWLSDDDHEEKRDETENGEIAPQPNISKEGNFEEENLLAKPQIPNKNKYVIPPIIAPHVEIKLKNCRRSERVSETKLPEKRKLAEKENDQAKKIKVDTFYDEKSADDNGWKRKRKQVTKEQIHEMRKKKLKEIAEKKPDERETKVRKSKTATAKVKVSDSRGKFLVENINMPSTSRAAHTSINDSLRPRDRVAARKTVHPKVSRNTSASINRTRAASAVHNDKYIHHPKATPCAPKSVNSVNAGAQTTVLRNCEGIGDILIRFLNWKTAWFQNWIEKKQLPPMHSKPLNRMSQNFSNYEDYYNTVMPLLELELWNYMIKGINEENEPRKKTFIAKIEHEIKMPNYTELECFTYITKEQSDTSSYLREEDAVIVQFAFRQNELNLTLPMIGYVTEVSKRILQDRDFMDADYSFGRGRELHNLELLSKGAIKFRKQDTVGKELGIVPHAAITFKVLVQAFNPTVESETYMRIKIIASLVPTTRIIRSVKYLEHSSLCQHVLKPTFLLYNLPRVVQEKLFSHDDLNAAQYQAVMEATDTCLRRDPGIYLVQGPPGTGKSTVIINIIQQILFRLLKSSNNCTQSCILVVAPSNAAVDELTLRLIKLKPKLEAEERKEIKLVRLGPQKMIHSSVQDYSLYELARRNIIDTFLNPERHPKPPKHLVSLQKEIAAMSRSGAAKSKLNAAKAELERGCRKVMGRLWHDDFRITEDRLLEKAKIICTTLSSCVGMKMQAVFGCRSKKIQCCIVDEATQSTEQETLIPLMLGIDKMVLVGDPKQLPAVTLSKEAKDYAYGQSLFSRIMSHFEGKAKNPIRMLDTQYRMHPAICEFPNRTYYDKKLNNAPVLKTRCSKLDVLKPYLVFNFKVDQANSQEYSNRYEIDWVVKLLEAIVINIRDSCAYSVGIVTPYNSQKEGIKEKINNKTFRPNVSITVNTVDSFQGQEKDIIIMSCVRDYSNSFVGDEQRLNVAMTRAKHALYIIGSGNLLKTCTSLGKVYDDAKTRGVMQVVSSRTSVTSLSEMIKSRQ